MPVRADASHPFELTIHMTTINFDEIVSGLSDVGGGLRATRYIHSHLAIEAEWTGMLTSFSTRRPHHFHQGVLGLKAGVQRKLGGVFGVLLPGVIRTRKSDSIDKVYHFVLDVGGGVEFYLPRQILLRYDIRDTIISSNMNRNIRVSRISPPFRSHHIRTSVALGVRF